MPTTEVRYRFVASDVADVTSAFDTIERRATQTARAQRTRTTSAESLARSSRAKQARDLKQAEKVLRDTEWDGLQAKRRNRKKAVAEADREASNQTKSRERDARKQTASLEREAKKRSRAVDREAKQYASSWETSNKKRVELERKAASGVETSRRKAGGGAMLGRVGRTLVAGAAIGVGMAAVGAGGALVRDAMSNREAAEELAIKGRKAGQNVDPDVILNAATNQAMASPGMKIEDMIAGMDAFVSETGDLESALKNLAVVTENAQATKTSSVDVQSIVAKFRQQGITDPARLSRLLSTMAVQGKEASMEMKDIAHVGGRVMASMTERFGMKASDENYATVGALMQMAKRTSGDPRRAATDVVSLATVLTDKGWGGVDKHGKEKKSIIEEQTGVKVDPNDLLDVTLTKIIAGAKGKQGVLSDIFTGKSGTVPLALGRTYRDAKAGGASDEEATYRVLESLRNLSKVVDAEGVVRRDALSRQQLTSSKLTAVWEGVVAMVQEGIVPSLSQLAGELPKLAPLMSLAVSAVGAFASSLASVIEMIGLIPGMEGNTGFQVAKTRMELGTVTASRNEYEDKLKTKGLNTDELVKLGALQKEQSLLTGKLDDLEFKQAGEVATSVSATPKGKKSKTDIVKSGVDALVDWNPFDAPLGLGARALAAGGRKLGDEFGIGGKDKPNNDMNKAASAISDVPVAEKLNAALGAITAWAVSVSSVEVSVMPKW